MTDLDTPAAGEGLSAADLNRLKGLAYNAAGEVSVSVIQPALRSLVRAYEAAANAPSQAGEGGLREALELAEDVLSRAPFSTQMWPNGMHPNTGIERIRAALAEAAPSKSTHPTDLLECAQAEDASQSPFDRALSVARMLHTNLRIARGERGLKAWHGPFVESEFQALTALSAPQPGVTGGRVSKVTCSHCDGSGNDPEGREDLCPYCEGEGLTAPAEAASPSPAALAEPGRAIRQFAIDALTRLRDVGRIEEGDPLCKGLFRALDAEDYHEALAALTQPGKPGSGEKAK